MTNGFTVLYNLVLQVRAALDEAGGPQIKAIAQIDTAEAIAAYDDILAAADGIMVSRSNLVSCGTR